MMHDVSIWQTCHRTLGRGSRQRPIPFAQSLMQVVQCPAHAFPGQRVDVVSLGLIEKLGDIGGRDGVVFEAGFEPLQPESRQHQQRRNKRCEQPRHKGEVNTAKVSAGSRIVTGPNRSALGRVGPPQYAGIRDRG
jgi:hypothetical protein